MLRSSRALIRSLSVAAGGTLVAAALAAAVGPGVAGAHEHRPRQVRHVLLISVDGMHQSDLDAYVAAHAHSALARLVHHGREFTRARTPFPSDSFPGMVGQVTGGDPRTTGVYYDVTYNPALLPPGTTDCSTATAGTVVAYDESVDDDLSSIDAGQGLSGLPVSILSMTGHPRSLIDPAQLPVDPGTCTPVYPDQYLKVNTIFQVAHYAGLRTAWSDKHPAYEILGGPGGAAIDDLFTPEINSDSDASGDDWTTVNSLTRQYDGYKVRAVLNEIDGYDHSGSQHVGTPAIFGLNFQSVSTAEKLPTSDGQAGGYLSDGQPGPVLAGSLHFVSRSIGRMLAELRRDGLAGSTAVILSAKHGQSPIDGASLTRIDDGTIIDQLDAAWTAAHPGAPDLVAGASDDDGMLLWLSDRSSAATGFAKSFLTAYDGDGTGTDGHAAATGIDTDPKPYSSAGLDPHRIYAGAAAAQFIGVPAGDTRVPDVIGIAQHGTVFTGGTKKIAEHGGDDAQDRDVPLVVSGPGVHHGSDATRVETTSIAPTILALLGLDPNALQAVQMQGTATLELR